MHVELTDTQRELRDTVRAFAQDRIKPLAAEIDRTGRYPRENLTGLGELGALGVFVPETYGGAGFDHVAYALAVEEVSAACGATGACFSAHTSLVCWPILALGTEDQRRRYLPKLARGEWLGSFALSEPGVGSDAAGLATTARRRGDGYVLNGAKNFITNAPYAGLAIVFASLDASRGTKGIGAFLVETTSRGWEVLRVEEKMGLHGAHTAQLAFTDLYVPRENLLGGEDEGFKVAMKTLDGGRIGIAAQAVGIARAAFEDALAYAQERRAFGQALAEFQGTQWKLSDMALAVEAARLLTLRAATLKDQGIPCTKEAAMAKLYASEAAMNVATQAVQIHGGYGYTREFAVERYFRDAKATEIYEGSSEIQRLVIAGQVLREGA
ncbi:MAG TPA: acyl-CoA dehydrogenase family protein [Candidatus Eisenbacteria bacterium]|nr:acyl-CoA dehydrogenase family protein [Candidatus Eisenbacteria bacterium]